MIAFPLIEPFMFDAEVDKGLHKVQGLKVLEESAELCEAVKRGEDDAILEAMDVLQALGNLIYMMGWTEKELNDAYTQVYVKNISRGRYKR